MSGKGKYTQYVPVASDRNTLLNKLFNNKAGDKGVIYGVAEQSDNSKAAAVVVARAIAPVVNGVGGLIPSDGMQQGDRQIFPDGVNMNFQGTSATPVPNLADVSWKSAITPSGQPGGGPANAYVPDLTSPGPLKTSGLDKADDPLISTQDIKLNYTPGGPDTGTQSPDTSSATIGTTSIGRDLLPGKSLA